MFSRLDRFPSLRAARRTVLVTAICASGVAGSAPPVQAATVDGTNPSTRLTVTDSNDPVSLSLPGKPAYLAYSITFANLDTRQITRVALTDALPAGSSLLSASSSRGACSVQGGTVTCPIGSINSGDAVTALIVIQTPTSGTSISNTVTASLNELGNDQPGDDPKQDTVTTTEQTTTAGSGVASSYVPANTGVQLSTDPTGRNVTGAGDAQVGAVQVPPQSNALTAGLAETAGAFTCPAGAVCRGGGWLQATVPGSFFPPLRFFLRWDKPLIQSGQTVKNFQMYHRAALDSGALEVISRKCSSANPLALELPCLWAVTKEKDGDFDAVLITNHNGYMR